MQVYRNDLRLYSKIRKKMQTGDIIAFKGTDFGAQAILLGTKSNYSHIGLVVRLDSISADRVFIIEAVPYGVMLKGLTRKLVYYTGSAWWAKLKCDYSESTPPSDKIRNKILD